MAPEKQSVAHLEWVRPPRQARSQQTLERLLDAAEKLIDEKGLDGVTVADIAKQAGSSVGAFYARFSDKEGLLHCVFERFNEQARATADAALIPERWSRVGLRDAFEEMVSFLAQVLRERRGLIVAMYARTAVDPSMKALAELLHGHLAGKLLSLLEQRQTALRHPDPEVAANVVVWMVLSSLQSRVIYADQAPPLLSDAVVAREVALMVSTYLGIYEARQDRAQALLVCDKAHLLPQQF